MISNVSIVIHLNAFGVVALRKSLFHMQSSTRTDGSSKHLIFHERYHQTENGNVGVAYDLEIN